VLLNPTNAKTPSDELQEAARALGLQLHVVYASSEGEIEAALASVGQLQERALMIPPDPLFLDRRTLLGKLTLRNAIPAIHSYREFAAAGGLMTYGGRLMEQVHEVGIYTGRILKGEQVATLPVQQATKVDLTLNMKTARTLGVKLPETLLGRADEVIE
jgi:putative ABC transport system substrate-binding protein